MSQTQGMPGSGQTGQLSIDNIQETMMNVVYNVATIVTMPVEILLRLQFGTTYFPAPMFFVSAVMMIVISAFVGVAGAALQMVPLIHFQGPSGLYGLGFFTGLFFLSSFIHGWRTWRRMLNMSLEENSTFEGPPLPFFSLLPKGKSFWFVRIVYEPVFVFVLSIVLAHMYIIQFPLASYLQIASVFLAMKQYVAWYKTWFYIRHLMDMANVGPIIARMVSNTATDDELASVHLASLPKDMPPDMREATVSHIVRAFSPNSER